MKMRDGYFGNTEIMKRINNMWVPKVGPIYEYMPICESQTKISIKSFLSKIS